MPDGTPEVSAAPHELATLFPAPRTVTVAGRVIDIERCTIAQGGRILDVGIPVWERLAHTGADPLTIFETHPDEAVAVLHAATGVDAEWLATLSPLDKLDLASQWMHVNAGFFVRRLLPILVRMRVALTAAFVGNGPTRSPISPPLDSTTAPT